MGQCGCGDMNLIAAYPIAGTSYVLGIDEYHGCRDCETPVGIGFLLFHEKGWEEWKDFLWGEMGPEVHFGQYGGGPDNDRGPGTEHGLGLHFPFIGTDDLMRAAREDKELASVDLSEYATLEDFLSDYGLRLIQAALRLRPKPE